MGRLFGTDGVRGIANQDLTPELVFSLGRAAAVALGGAGARVVVGRDPRLSGDLLQAALAAGLISAGAEVWQAGVVPTAAVSYLTGYHKARAGAMISASHNPVPDNGLKFFGPDGFKLPDELEERIEALVANPPTERPVGNALKPVVELGAAALNPYREHLLSIVSGDFAGFKVVLDLAHGSATTMAAQLFADLGLEVLTLHHEPDGSRINVSCGSTHPEALQQAVVEAGADLGLAFDGDADRLIAVDHKGRVVDGDHLLYTLGSWALHTGELPGGAMVATVMSNLGLKLAFNRRGGKIFESPVGDRQVLERMQATGAQLGGEQSGHLILLQHSPTGDGLLTALKLLEVLRDSGRGLAEWRDEMPKFPQVLINVRVKDKHGWERESAIRDSIRQAEDELGEAGRIFVRPSGTESLIRVMVEGPQEEHIRGLAGQVAATIEATLGHRA